MNKDLIDKIMTIIDLSFDVLFYNTMAEEVDIREIYKDIREKLKDIE